MLILTESDALNLADVMKKTFISIKFHKILDHLHAQFSVCFVFNLRLQVKWLIFTNIPFTFEKVYMLIEFVIFERI